MSQNAFECTLQVNLYPRRLLKEADHRSKIKSPNSDKVFLMPKFGLTFYNKIKIIITQVKVIKVHQKKKKEIFGYQVA